jgi:hypothetical protein
MVMEERLMDRTWSFERFIRATGRGVTCRALIPLFLATALAGCGDDDNPLQGGPEPSTSYTATIPGIGPSGEPGTLNLTVQQVIGPAPRATVAAAIDSVTGTLTITGQAPIDLQGTYDSDTGEFSATSSSGGRFSGRGVTGGGYSFTGTITLIQISGTWTGPTGSGSFLGTNSALVNLLADWQFTFTGNDCGELIKGTGYARFTFQDGHLVVHTHEDAAPHCEIDHLTVTELSSGVLEAMFCDTDEDPPGSGCIETDTGKLHVEFTNANISVTVSEGQFTFGPGCPEPFTCNYTLNAQGTRCEGECLPKCTPPTALPCK